MSKYSETLVNEAKDLLEECINRPTTKYTLEERNELISLNKTLKWVVDHAKELPLENWDKSLIVKSNYSPIFFSLDLIERITFDSWLQSTYCGMICFYTTLNDGTIISLFRFNLYENHYDLQFING